ncbi:hypothetical protein Pint_25726 [Pistacia integerrima]|uniref:Uncharacterized protein n=1 Tax=Pistacia integerrima TaxID=434235 RepID=A0ACC0YFI7_9ROSI|nr:hypothetical protein Pint_25726 [Pistacia integerrima]
MEFILSHQKGLRSMIQ